MNAQQIEEKMQLLEESLLLAEELQVLEHLLEVEQDRDLKKDLVNQKAELEERIQKHLKKIQKV